MTPPLSFAPPRVWHGLLTTLDETLHINDDAPDVAMGTVSGDTTMIRDAFNPLLQIVMLWGALEPYATATVHGRDMGKRIVRTSSFARFTRLGFHGELRRVDLPALGLEIGVSVLDDYIVRNTDTLSSHMRIKRADILAPWAQMNTWPEHLTTAILARQRQLSVPDTGPNLCSEITLTFDR